MNNWKKIKLKDISDITRGASPRPIHNFISRDKNNIPWVKIRDATSSKNRFIEKTVEFIKLEAKSKSVFIKKDDLIVSNSATPGLPKIMKIDACIHDGWLLIKNFRGVKKEFLYYTFLKDRKNLISKGTGTVFTNLKTDILKNHTINLPSLEEQESIVNFLSDFDIKIELNQKLNLTYEKIANTVFKSWFVDFEPTITKTFKEISNLPNQINELFPDTLEESEIGKIPKGWEVKKLGDILSYLGSGKRPIGGASIYDDQIPSIGAENVEFLGNYNYSKEKFISRKFYEELKSKGCSIKDYDILIYKDGANIGRSTIFGKGFPHKECTINEHVHLIRSKPYIQKYLYFVLSSKKYQQELQSLNTASAQPGINQTQLKTLKILLPKKEILEKFNELVSPLIDIIFKNSLEINVLIKIRDILIKKVLSNEIKLNGVR